MNFAEGAQTVSSFKFAGQVKAKTCHFKFPGPGRHSTPVAALRTTLLVALRFRSGKCAQHAANDVQTVITCTTISYTSNSLAQHQLRSSGRFRRPLAPSCAGLAFDRQNRSNQIESHPKKKPWCGPGAGSKTEAAEPASLSRSPTDCDTCGNLCRRGVGVTPTSVREVCQKQTHYPELHLRTAGMPQRTCEGALKYNTPAL